MTEKRNRRRLRGSRRLSRPGCHGQIPVRSPSGIAGVPRRHHRLVDVAACEGGICQGAVVICLREQQDNGCEICLGGGLNFDIALTSLEIVQRQRQIRVLPPGSRREQGFVSSNPDIPMFCLRRLPALGCSGPAA